jgi:hypothetical protein
VVDFYESRYGNVRLWLSGVDTARGNTLVIHEPSAGRNYTVQDRGEVLLRCTLQILFDQMIDDIDPLDRYRQFYALATDGKPHVLTHPIEGSFLARVENVNQAIDQNGVIGCSAVFVQVESSAAILQAGASTVPATGSNAVAASAASLDLALAEIESSSNSSAVATATADAWTSDPTVTSREVVTQSAALTNDLYAESATFDDSLESWEAQRATLLLLGNLYQATDSVLSDTSQTFSLKLGSAVALRLLVASIYGADEADSRYSQVLILNDIADPSSLSAGVELLMPAVDTRSRNA